MVENLLSYFSTTPNNQFLLQEITGGDISVDFFLFASMFLSTVIVDHHHHHIQHSHFPWRARRRCGTAWGRTRRSSWCGRGCTWPACWWRIWPEDRRHSRASTAPVHSNSRSEEEGEDGGRSASTQTQHQETHLQQERRSDESNTPGRPRLEKYTCLFNTDVEED